MFTFPNGSEDKCKNRIIDMFHSNTEQCIKDEIVQNFTTQSHQLHFVIATVAFGMEDDVPDIHTLIYYGACEDVDMYVEIQ